MTWPENAPALDPLSRWREKAGVRVAPGRASTRKEKAASLRLCLAQEQELQPTQRAPIAAAHPAPAAGSLRGQSAQAIETAKLEPDEFWRNYALALAWLLKNDSDDGAMQIAAVYAQRKQADEAFRWLEHALDTHDPGVTELYATSCLNVLHDDPRFAELAKKIGLPLLLPAH
jgi:hypothetical protein